MNQAVKSIEYETRNCNAFEDCDLLDFDYDAAVQDTLIFSEKHILSIKVIIVDDFEKCDRILSIIEDEQEYSVYVYFLHKNKVTNVPYIYFERRITINDGLRFDIHFPEDESVPVSLTIFNDKEKLAVQTNYDVKVKYFTRTLAKYVECSFLKTKLSIDSSKQKMTEFEESAENPLSMEERLTREYYLNEFLIFIGTWNVSEQSPKESLENWLTLDSTAPDLYVIAFQEIDLSIEALMTNRTCREANWVDAVTAVLDPLKYKILKLKRLVGIMGIVIIKEQLSKFVINVDADSVGTGLIGKLGNKGGVAIRFDYHTTSFCFVIVHLAAHLEACESRINNYNNICEKISFTRIAHPLKVIEHDRIFFMGDMNFRLAHLERDEIIDLVRDKRYDILLRYDQLNMNKRLKKIFVDFNEGKIEFPPTFKFDPGTNIWDSSEKQRSPAWCDRILFKGANIKVVRYSSHQEYLQSDHKPVSGLFKTEVTVIDPTKERQFFEKIIKKINKMENLLIPQAKVNNLEVKFNDIYFLENKTETLTITNTGIVPVKFIFQDNENTVKWMKIEPKLSTLYLEEKRTVEFHIYIDKTAVHLFKTRECHINEVIVLHIDEGRDYFITVSGKYIPGSFGRHIEDLKKTPNTEQLLESDEIFKKSKLYNLSREVPEQLAALGTYIFKFGLKEQELFIKAGIAEEMTDIIKIIDSGINYDLMKYQLELTISFRSYSIHSVAQVLILLLETLAEPVIPYEYFQELLKYKDNYVKCEGILNTVPKINRDVFKYVIYLLHHIIQYDTNQLNDEILCNIFGAILLKEPAVQTRSLFKNRNISTKKKKVIQLFLNHV